ncbi:MAG: acyl carrier protein, partial [Saccharothrix sp.]|nr:acyl carrier protein [Saccharothrix sp.]
IHLLRSYDIALSADIESKVDREMQALEQRLRKVSEKTRATVAAVSVELEGRADGAYTDVERTVAQCLALAFGYETLDVEADFFDLGGDSIMAGTVAGTIAVVHDVAYDVADLLADRTIAEIAYHVEDLVDFAAADVA